MGDHERHFPARVGFNVPGECLNLTFMFVRGKCANAEQDVSPLLSDGFGEPNAGALIRRAVSGVGIEG